MVLLRWSVDLITLFFLGKLRGDDRRKYFMINIHESMRLPIALLGQAQKPLEITPFAIAFKYLHAVFMPLLSSGDFFQNIFQEHYHSQSAKRFVSRSGQTLTHN